MTTAVNAEQQTSSAIVGRHGNAATGDNADRDYITMDDLLQDRLTTTTVGTAMMGMAVSL